MAKKPKKQAGKASKKNKTKNSFSSTLKKNYPILAQISKTRNPSRITSILKELPNSGVNSVCECLFNALYSKNLDKRSLDKLKKLSSSTKENIRALALAPKNRGFKQKRILLAQSGSGIGTVIASVLPLLLSLFTKK